MTNKQSRRGFFQTAGLGAASAACTAGLLGTNAAPARAAEGGKKPAFELGMASYTLRKFDLDTALAMTNRVGLEHICLKSFHLPLDASSEEIAAAADKVKAAGIDLYGCGVVTMKKAEDVDPAFKYAQAAGMRMIVGKPKPELLPLVNEKVQEYDIQVAIHNHGPGDEEYPTPEVGYERIKELDPRIGLCIDIGHVKRLDLDPAESILRCADRVLDMHFKDVTQAAKEGKSTPCGRGVIDLVAVMRALIEINYSGIVSFEYESEADDPLAGVAECVGYTRGLIAALS